MQSATMTPANFLPNLKPPFGWDLVTVLDPRVHGRTLDLWLVVREFPVVKPKGAPADAKPPVKRVLVSPMIPSDKNTMATVRSTISLAVVDKRYSPQVVELCLTLHQAEMFRSSFASSKKAKSILMAKEAHPRFKCYIPGCKATSSVIDKLSIHFQLGLHPGNDFNKGKVQFYIINGPQDPAVLKTPPPFLILPPAVDVLEGRESSGRQYARSDRIGAINADAAPIAGTKRARDRDSRSDTHPKKLAKTATYKPSLLSTVTYGKLPIANNTNSVHRLVDEYHKNHPVAGEVQAEEQELLCVCLQPKDGRQMIPCYNGDACRLGWFHPECIGMTADDIPPSHIPWFCPECLKAGYGGKRTARAASVTPLNLIPRKKLNPRSARERAQQAVARNMEELGGVIDRFSDESLSPPSPSAKLQPLTAGMVSSFGEDSNNAEAYGITSLASAKASLRARATEPVSRPTAKRNTLPGDTTEYSSMYKSPNCRSWSAGEEQHLKEVVKECADAGLAGEALWAAVHPKMVARGVNRPVGGMKMRWCRGLREETKIDERRKKNKKLLTAVQKPTKDKDPDAPKKGRFKGKGQHETNRASASSSTSTPPAIIGFPQPLPTTYPPVLSLATVTFPVTTEDVYGNGDGKSKVAHQRSASV